MAGDINIGIGAKGAATAALGLKKVGDSANHLQRDLGGLSKATAGLRTAFAPLLGIFAAFKGLQAVSSAISQSNEAFLTQSRAARGATDAQKSFASEMQGALGIGDEVTLGIMRQARALGIQESQLEEAAKAAVGLSNATGEGHAEALKKVNRAMQGQTDAFAEAIPGLKDMKTETEKLAAINDLISRGLEEQSNKMQGLEGIQTRATNSWGDMLEVIGEILAPIRAIVSQGIAVFAESMQSALVPAVELARAAMANLPPILDVVSQAVIGAVTVVDVAFNNLPGIVQIASETVQLSMLQISESVKHVFTSTIPQYLTWFGENWYTMLTDIFSAGLTVAQNYVQNYADTLLALWDWVASGFKGGAGKLFSDVTEIATRSLLDGFEAKTAALPDIIERKITDREQQLAQSIGKVATRIGDEFTNKFNDRLAAAQKTFESFKTTADIQFTDTAQDKINSKQDATQKLAATESRLLTRGRGDDPNAKIADNTKATVAELKKLNAKKQEQPPALNIRVGTA